MNKQQLQNLYNLLPNFQHDRDESWQQYLPEGDNLYLKRMRNEFLGIKEEEEDLMTRMKQHSNGSVGHESLKNERNQKRRELDLMINELKQRVPILKATADMRRRLPVDMEVEEDELFMNNFLPSHLAPEKRPPEPPISLRASNQFAKESTQSLSEPQERAEPPPDTYLDGVRDENVEIMIKMRPLAEKYDCRDKILAALRSIRRRDNMINDVLNPIKLFVADSTKK